MCTVITLIAATDDLDRINAILAARDRRGYRRRALRDDAPGLRALLGPDERAYALSRQPCDCGTFLGHAQSRGAAPEADEARARRKGWSEARIARARADRDRAAARPPRRPPNEDAAYWITLMGDLAAGLGLRRLGLMQHEDGRPGQTEGFPLSRRDGGPIRAAAPVLAQMPAGVIHDFRPVS